MEEFSTYQYYEINKVYEKLKEYNLKTEYMENDLYLL